MMKESATRIDAYGAEYSADRLTLLKDPQISSLSEYRIEKGTRLSAIKHLASSLLQTIDIPDSVTIIEDSAFSACTSLQDFHIPNSVTEIQRAAFWGCTSLQPIYIPDSVTEIGVGAFSYCEALQFIRIPQNIELIKNDIFKGCQLLSSIQLSDVETYHG